MQFKKKFGSHESTFVAP